jgi:Arc/MetJ-type ribon-helix-helix transcriptional regulator
LYYTYYMSNMTTVRLPDDLAAAIAKLSARDGIPASEQIRRALRLWLAKKGVYGPKKEKK